jgi:hypothetical protein
MSDDYADASSLHGVCQLKEIDMIRRLFIVVPAIALLGACVTNDHGEGINGKIYRPDYKERRDYDRRDDRRRDYGNDDYRRYGRRGDPNAINDYNRPGP